MCIRDRGNIIRLLVIAIKCKHTSGQGIHNVLGRCFHDNVPYELRRTGALVRQKLGEILQFLLIRKLAEQ